jgi:hypothetical protein
MIRYGRYALKPKYSFLETRKKSLTIGVIILAVFISVIFLTYMAFDESGADTTCGEWDWNAKCELSPAAHMIYGDIITGGSIALFLSWFFHRLTHRNQLKIEQIIESDQAIKNKRKDYAVGHLKNLLTTLFFTMNTLKGSLSNYNNVLKLPDHDVKIWSRSTYLSRVRADEAKVGRILMSVRNILIAINDVLEPEVVNRVEGVCNFIGELSVQENPDGTMEFPKVSVSKIKVQYLLEMLKTYTVASRSFRDIEQYYESSAFVSRGALSGDVARSLNQEAQH